MLGPAEPDAPGPEAARDDRLLRDIRIGPHAERPELVSPFQQRGEVPVLLGLLGLEIALDDLDDFGLDDRDLSGIHGARETVDGKIIAFLERARAEAHQPIGSYVQRFAPATHTLPIWRATTAAWEVMPPLAVRNPTDAFMPWMSSGLVSRRTRIARSPRSFISTARSGVSAILPAAAPGPAGRPLPTGWCRPSCLGSKMG